MAVSLLAAFACAAGALALDCHVFERVSDCKKNGDCPLGQACHPSADFCETKPHIVFGALLPDLSVSDLRNSLTPALDLVTVTVNGAGGILGKPIEFKIVSDRPNEVTLASMKFLVEDERVAGVVGGTNSSVALVMQQVASPAKVLNISSEATSPALSSAEPPIDRYFFRTTATARHGEALAQAIFSRSGSPPLCKNTFIVDDDSAFARGYRDAYRETFTKLGGCLIDGAIVSSSVQQSYADVIAKIQAATPDCLLLALFSDVAAAFIREAKATLAADTARDWSKLTWLSGSPLYSTQFLKLDAVDPTKPDVQTAEGVFISAGDTTPDTPEYYRFRTFFNDHYGLPPAQDTDVDVSNTFDAAVLLVLAVERAGSLDRVAIRDALWHLVTDSDTSGVYGPDQIVEMLRILRLRQGQTTCTPASHNAPCEIRYRGASSPLVFDDYGTVSSPAAIYKLKGNGFDRVKRYGQDDFDAFEAAAAKPPSACPLP
jgi:ABC-type branched-subunit amino acid transport system substrate-binding protein